MIEQPVDSSARAGPRPRRLAVAIPTGVLVALTAVVGWTAWPLIRPAREVEVAQAVFDRSALQQQSDEPGNNTPDVPTVQAAGWLEAEPFYVACTALADGIVERVEVLEGERVEKGQVVARLVAEDSKIRLRRAEAELSAAEARLASAQAEREAARRAWDHPVEMERAVEAGAAALAEARGELAQLPSLIDSARATLTRLKEEEERVRRSTERGVTTELERIVAEQRTAAQRAEVEALEARRPILQARVERLRAELRAARRDLELRIEDRRRLDAAEAAVAGARGEVDRARARRDEAALELDRMVIRAPISGYVQKRLKVPGDKAIRMMDSPESAHVVHLYDPESLRVRVDVPLADASHVHAGQACEVVVEVLPDRVFKGEVLRTTHEADLQKNTLEMQVKVIDPDPILRPEMLTRVKFLPPTQGRRSRASAGDSAGRVLVPNEAVPAVGDTVRVWLVTDRRNGRGVLSARSVQVVERGAGWATVRGDVPPGALLAVGLDGGRPGERVVIRDRNEGSEPS